MYQNLSYAAYTTAGFIPNMRIIILWKRIRSVKWKSPFQKESRESPHLRNESTVAKWPEPTVPFATGTSKEVYRGHYRDGPRRGQECVSKKFTTRSKAEEDLCEDEIRISQRAKEIVTHWNMARIIDIPVVLSVPEIWDVWTSADSESLEKRLVEPFINNFQKFHHDRVSTDTQIKFWNDALQALSHFSYHFSAGRMVLCDIQGGICKEKFILSSPAILSTSGSYGVADLGAAGINQFFERHQCNNLCNPKWIKP